MSSRSSRDEFVDADVQVAPDGRRWTTIDGDEPVYVDMLCCQTFHGTSPYPGAIVVHLNDDVSNDCAANLKWSTPLVRSRTPADRIQNDWHLFYWSTTMTTGAGFSLKECVENFGVGGWVCESKNMVAALVFLDDSRSASNSFLLAIKPMRKSHSFCPITAQEEDPCVLKICPRHGVGKVLVNGLAQATFA